MAVVRGDALRVEGMVFAGEWEETVETARGCDVGGVVVEVLMTVMVRWESGMEGEGDPSTVVRGEIATVGGSVLRVMGLACALLLTGTLVARIGCLGGMGCLGGAGCCLGGGV